MATEEREIQKKKTPLMMALTDVGMETEVREGM